MSEALHNRPGLNGSEAAIAWAYARFGGDVEACGVLAADAGRPLRAIVSDVTKLSDDERAQLVEAWRQQDRRWDSLDELSARLESSRVATRAEQMASQWREALLRVVAGPSRKPVPWHACSVRTRRAVVWLALRSFRDELADERAELRGETGFDLVQLAQMAPRERNDWIRQLGVFQLVELTREQDRRSMARLRRALRGDDRAWFDACLEQERDIDRLERGRLRELFVSVSRQEPDLSARLSHLGLYTLAASAGGRFARKLRHVGSRLPTTLQTLLLHYHRIERERALADLAPLVRGSLNLFVDRRMAFVESTRPRLEVSND